MTIAVLIIRPEPSGTLLADQLRARWGCGMQMVLSPIMRIDWMAELPDLREVKTLIFTSQHGVTALARLSDRRDIPCYAVGPATAARAQAQGFDTIEADGDADALLARIKADKPLGNCLHIRGAHSVGDIAQRLTQSGIPTSDVVLYHQRPCPLLPEAQNRLNREAPVILPLYSPRSAELFFSQSRLTAPLLVAAISANVAAKVPKSAVQSLVVADRSEGKAMLKAMDALYETAKRLEGRNRAQ